MALFISQTQYSIKKKKIIYLVIASIPIFILYNFKNNFLFPDINEYFSDFVYYAKTNNYFTKHEIGWDKMSFFLSRISSNPLILVVLISIVVIVAFFSTVYRYSNILWLSIFIFLCSYVYFSFFILRQYLAMAICLFTIPYILKRRFIPYLIITLIAISFHYSAIIWLVVYFIFYFKFNWKYILGVIFIAILFIKYQSLLLYSDFSYGTNLHIYVESGFFNLNSFIVSLFPIAVFVSGNMRNFKDVNGIDILALEMSLISVILNILVFFNLEFNLLFRVSNYFSLLSFLLIPNSIYKIKNSLLIFIMISITIIFYLLLLSREVSLYGFKYNF